MIRTSCCLVIVMAILSPDSRAAEIIDFDLQVAPILASQCIVCHNRNDFQGELDLTRRTSAMAGGESGPVIIRGDPEESLLWQYVSQDEMPPDHPLADTDKEILHGWIQSGADWGTDQIDPFQTTNAKRAGYDWWSLQPLAKPTPPAADDSAKSAIDAFVLRRLRDRGLVGSPPADSRTLVRRLSFDLLGLPPDADDLQAFLEDPTDSAYEHLVDKMLQSPHYGERWARHWLDVARFGESDGFEYDKLRPNAWRYRDWVVRAINDDMPYDKFVRWQIAGDVIQPGNPDAVMATGFLICGAHDSLIPAGDIQRAIMRQDELEDLVATVSQTCLGMTVNCARCHDHKFDPILQLDYYRISAGLAGVKRGDRAIPPTANVAALDRRIERLQQAIRAIEEPVRQAILRRRKDHGEQPAPPQPVRHWRFDDDLNDHISGLAGTAHGPARNVAGKLYVNEKSYVSTSPVAIDIGEKTLAAVVQLNSLNQRGGAAISLQTTDGVYFDAIVFGEREAKRWMAGSNGFARTQSFGGPAETEADKQPVHIAITYKSDGTITCYRNGQLYGQPYKTGIARFAKETAQVLFGLRHGTGVSDGRMLSGGILEAALYDHALSPHEVAAAAGAMSQSVSREELLASLDSETRAQLVTAQGELKALRGQRQGIANIKTFAVTPNKNPGIVHLLARGNPRQPAEEVAPGGIAAVIRNAAAKNHLPVFDLPADASDADRRRMLADWISSADNPLFARAIVNRVWHYHFGAGLVRTPNDLGFNGGQASHPELLDWLAATLIEQEWSLKQLHRTIVTSATYRQSSHRQEQNMKVDADNRYLWRMSPRRLEAEAVRDAVLVTAGQFNPQVGGRPYRDWKMFQHKGGWNYAPLDPDGAEFNRRSIYRTWARGGRNPLLDTFDCPDPSATSPARGVTTTPLQALALLNNSFILRMAEHFADRIENMTHSEGGQVKTAFQLALSREPSAQELDITKKLAREQGLQALCRVLLNSNEFLYLD